MFGFSQTPTHHNSNELPRDPFFSSFSKNKATKISGSTPDDFMSMPPPHKEVTKTSSKKARQSSDNELHNGYQIETFRFLESYTPSTNDTVQFEQSSKVEKLPLLEDSVHHHFNHPPLTCSPTLSPIDSPTLVNYKTQSNAVISPQPSMIPSGSSHFLLAEQQVDSRPLKPVVELVPEINDRSYKRNFEVQNTSFDGNGFLSRYELEIEKVHQDIKGIVDVLFESLEKMTEKVSVVIHQMQLSHIESLHKKLESLSRAFLEAEALQKSMDRLIGGMKTTYSLMNEDHLE